jgi:Protein of unknown function (DUF2924)
MGEDIPEQLAGLQSLPRQQLLDLWRKLYRRAAPTGFKRDLMVPFLAYRIQEIAYGGLRPSTRSELRRIARRMVNSSTASNRQICQPKLKSGTRILRKWRGETHEVVVTESGFEYRRARYKSLSEIARKITGTRWSGPAFFGLKFPKANLDRHDE